MYWKEILQAYEDMGVEDIIPIAHTRVKPNIKVLLDESGNFVGAMLNQDRFTIPCTIESESRTSGCAPHPIHDNMQYLCNEYDDQKCKEKHESYMKQLKEYIEEVDDELAKSVYRFLEKGLLRDCIKDLLKKVNLPEEKVMVCFAMVSREALTRVSESEEKYKAYCLHALQSGEGQDFQWRDYYLKTLEPNGVCSITGKPDFIPPTYPKGIRNSRDSAKLFVGGSTNKIKENLDGMPTINPGYVITQKIAHTLQCLNYEGAHWGYQVVRDNKGITNETVRKIENELEMTEEEKKRFEKRIEKSFHKMAKNKEWMAKKDGEESYDD